MIIFLNGNSSSGKSEIARAMMHQSDRPFLYYSIDHLINFWIDEKFVAFEDEPKAWFFQEHSHDISQEGSSRVEGPQVNQLRWDMIEAMGVLIKKGYDLIIDEVLWKKDIFQHYVKTLNYGKKIYLVKIFCELLEAERREKLRADRYQGIARSLYETVYTEPPGYDLEIDSTYTSTDKCAEKILEYVNHHASPTAFLIYLKNAICFVPLAQAHFALLHEWLNMPHLNEGRKDGETWTLCAVEKAYESYVHGYKEIHGKQKSIWCFIICCDETPIGYAQLYNAHDFSQNDILQNFGNSVAGLDLFIGDPGYLNKGLEVASIDKFLDQFVWKMFDNCLVQPAVAHNAATQAYLQAGFKVIKQLTASSEIIMIKKKIT